MFRSTHLVCALQRGKVGIVVKWLPKKMFGFIVEADDPRPVPQRPQYFVHHSHLHMVKDTLPINRGLAWKEKVLFDAEERKDLHAGKGLTALNVRALDGGYLPNYVPPRDFGASTPSKSDR